MTIQESTFGGAQLDIPVKVGHYQYVRTLGSGAWSVVVEVVHIGTERHLACKVVSRVHLTENHEFSLFEQELRLQEWLRHPSIVQIHEVIFTPDLVYVFLDLCAGGDFLTFIVDHPDIPPGQTRGMLIEILEGLQYIHSRGIIHRDIKAENILLTDDGHAKIGDFGLSEVESAPNPPKSSGTIFYAAPEVFLRPHSVTTKADIWSFGILLFVLVSRKLPLHDGDDGELMKQIVTRSFTGMHMLSRDHKVLFDACTQLDPSARPSAEQLLDFPWLRQERQTVRRSSTGPAKLSPMSMRPLQKRPVLTGRCSMASRLSLSVRPRSTKSTSVTNLSFANGAESHVSLA
jgi:carbon catabolite-derepressing protein kinase